VRFGVVLFPGSNCERDTLHVLTNVLGQQAELIWHEQTDISAYDCIILPGGFAHGDALRAGAIARFSPVMSAVERFARADRLVWGICNGFQILLEAGLLPGAMLRNRDQRFICDTVPVRIERVDLPFTRAFQPGEVIRLPIAHGEGNYVAPAATLAALERRGQVVLRYCSPAGRVDPLDPHANPNGSVNAIAGLCNEGGNVFGLMPHPERASEAVLGNTDGLRFFTSLLDLAAMPRQTAGVARG